MAGIVGMAGTGCAGQAPAVTTPQTTAPAGSAERADNPVAIRALERRLVELEAFRRSVDSIAASVSCQEIQPDAYNESLHRDYRAAVETSARASEAALDGGDEELARVLGEAAEAGERFLADVRADGNQEPRVHRLLAAASSLLEHVSVALQAASQRDVPGDARGLSCVSARFATLPTLHTELLSLRSRWETARDEDMVRRRNWMYGQERARASLAALIASIEEATANPRRRASIEQVRAALHPEDDSLTNVQEYLPDALVDTFNASVLAFEAAERQAYPDALEALHGAAEDLMEAVEGEYPESGELLALESTVDYLSDLVEALESDGRFAAAHAAIVPRDDAELERALERSQSDLERITALCGQVE
jgi:hypothetical protein